MFGDLVMTVSITGWLNATTLSHDKKSEERGVVRPAGPEALKLLEAGSVTDESIKTHMNAVRFR